MNDAFVSQSSMRDWSLDLDRGLIIRAGKPVAVRHKLFEILAFLARNPNRVISKDELIQSIWGGVAITDDALTQTISQARKCIGDENREIIRTIPKRGFLLASAIPLKSEPLENPPSEGRNASGDPAAGPIVVRRNSFGVSADLAQRMQVYAVDSPLADGTSILPPRLSIVVLPFANLGGDPEQEYFADGVTESLTTELSRIRGAFVIAPSTAFTFKGKPIDVRAIARELNVRYALEGSVLQGGDRIRVNVQLLDAQSGSHLWAERFDKPIADFFDMQDEIVARLGSQLGVELIRAEAAPAGDGGRDPAPHASPERRHVTVLAAELAVGEGRSLPADPEDFRAVIDAFRRCAAEALAHYGSAIRESRGREIVAFFGYPSAHENDAERAVRAALALQRALSDLGGRAAGNDTTELSARIGLEVGGGNGRPRRRGLRRRIDDRHPAPGSRRAGFSAGHSEPPAPSRRPIRGRGTKESSPRSRT